MNSSSPLILNISESTQQGQNQEQKAQNAKRSWHTRCLLLNIILLYTLYVAIDCQLVLNALDNGSLREDSESSCLYYKEKRLAILYIPLLPYIFYIIECYCCSETRKYLNKDMKVVEYETFINQLKSARPQLAIKVECWHMESSSQTLSSPNYGEESQSHNTYQEKVISHTDWSVLPLRSWKDATGDIIGVFEGGLVRLEVEKDYEFGDLESLEKFQKERQDLIKKNERRDQNISDYAILQIDGYEERVMVQNRGGEEKCCTSIKWYWVWSLVGLSWPYRIWVESSSPKKRITIKKILCLR